MIEKVNSKSTDLTTDEATMRAKKYLADKSKEASSKLLDSLYKKKSSLVKQNYEETGIPRAV